MSSIVSPENTVSLQESTGSDGGLDVVGLEDIENNITIKGDASASIIGGNLKDTITTGAGDDIIFTGAGDDIVKSGTGNDILRGSVGGELFQGGPGDDVIIGGAGNDTIKGGEGSVNLPGDALKGGTGEDVFEFAASEFKEGSVDEIKDFKADGFADVIQIFDKKGVIGQGDITYDSTSGLVSFKGEPAINIGENLEVKISENDQGQWELF